ncbi:hypothetical protein WME79_25700 [Sorangium sp. So ce726]|uniref:hypothetical protein n=1 Tax=Sorangium sp. So ce726 TaxID=3133319 RepID=UPI003F5F240A
MNDHNLYPSCEHVAELAPSLIRRRRMWMSVKLMGAVMVSVGTGFACGFAGGFAGAAWAAGGTADVSASVTEGKDSGCGAKGQIACPTQGWIKTGPDKGGVQGEAP